MSKIRYADELGPYRVTRSPFFEQPSTSRKGIRPAGLVVEFMGKDWKERRTYAVFGQQAADAAEPTYWIRIGPAPSGEKFFLRPPVKIEE